MRTGTILDKILEFKRIEVEKRKKETPISELDMKVRDQPYPLNFSGALWGEKVRLIAEVKKASPSRGVMSENYDPIALSKFYAENGAAAISVLTEVDHFQGSLEDLSSVKKNRSWSRNSSAKKRFSV